MATPTAGQFLGFGAGVFSGVSALLAANDQASLLREQGALTRDDYFRQAALVREDGHRTRAKQAMEYVSAGVELAGTPLLMLRETLSKAGAKSRALEVTGLNYERLYNRKAQITKNEGRAKLVGDIMTGASLLL